MIHLKQIKVKVMPFEQEYTSGGMDERKAWSAAAAAVV